MEFDDKDFAIIITALYYLYIDSKYEYLESHKPHHEELMKESHRLFEKILNERGAL